MKRYTFLLFLIIGSISTSYAQHVCGTTIGTERLIENRERVAHEQVAVARNAITYVPLKVHLVARNDGSGRANEALMPDMLCNLNTEFEGTDIQFYFDMPFNYIENTPLYTESNEGGGSFAVTTNKVNDAMNLFIVGGFTEAGLGGFYQGPPGINDYIIMPISGLFGFGIPHEAGHFFSLAHPFYGWGQAGDTGWDPAVHGNPVGPVSPNIGVPQSVPNEKMDQSNCLEAGDAICDTPPDYLFATSPLYSNGSCSTVNLGAMDPDGELVVAMENNIMNYYFGCSDYIFTDDQAEAMVNDLYSPSRNYLRPEYTPNLTEITEAPELVSPINGESTPGYNLVEFDWNEVPGADYYLLEIDFLPTFSAQPSRFIVDGATFKVVEDIFNASSTYYWRVRPFGEFFNCGVQYSERGDFVTGSVVSTREVAEVNGWNILPNPVRANGILQVEVEASQSFKGSINLYSTTGQLLKSIRRMDFAAGMTNVDVDVNGLAAGIYIATIETDLGVMNKRVLITK